MELIRGSRAEEVAQVGGQPTTKVKMGKRYVYRPAGHDLSQPPLLPEGSEVRVVDCPKGGGRFVYVRPVTGGLVWVDVRSLVRRPS
jgi:hypothetical protein